MVTCLNAMTSKWKKLSNETKLRDPITGWKRKNEATNRENKVEIKKNGA